MAGIPDNIIAILGTDNAGNVVSIEADLFRSSTETVSVQTSVLAPVAQTTQSPVTNVTVQNNNAEPLIFDASSNYIPVVNSTKDNLNNSIMYQYGTRIGVNTANPVYTFDVYGGSINVTPLVLTDGYRINKYNLAYQDISKNTIYIGDATYLKIINVNSLLISGLATTPDPVTPRVLAINKDGLVSPLSLTSGSVIFSDSIGLVQDNNNFFWDNTNKRLGIGNKTPTEALHVTGSIRQSVVTSAMLKADSTGKIVAAVAGTDYLAASALSGYLLASTAAATYQPIGSYLTSYTEIYQGTVTAVSVASANGFAGTVATATSTPAITISTTITGLLKGNGTAISAAVAGTDYLATISGISAGGELSGTYPNPTLVNSAVTGKILTGYTALSGTVSATDTILQAFGRVQSQLSALSGSLIYKGSWNASTNNPTIVSGTGVTGNYYIVSVAGTTTIDGISSWNVGDWIVFNGTTSKWEKIANQSVISINGFTGVVVISTTNITEGTNFYYTNARGIGSTLTGYVSGAGTISSADTILGAIQKLNGNIGALVTGVSSVSGTTNRITASPTTGAVVVDIASTYVGQVSITTLGTVGTGAWQGTAIADTYISSASVWNAKEPAIASGTTLQYWRGDKTWQTLPIYTLSGLGGEPAITGGTTAQYWRGDKTWQNLPVYTISGLGGEPAITGGTTAQYWRGDKSWQTLPIYTLSGLGGEPAITGGTTAQYWRGDKSWQTLNTNAVAEGTNLYYTDARVNANSNVAANTAARHNAVTLGTANGLLLSTQVLSLGLSSTSATGALSSTDWNTFNSKEPAIAGGTITQYWRGDKSWQTLNTDVVAEGTTNLYYTEARVNANSNVAANTAARHNAVTIGTANGLSLSTQVLSLGLSGASTTGALNSTDWNIFNSKEPAIAGGTITQYWRGDKSWQTLPTYTLSGLGGVPTSRTLTINGVSYDLSLDRSWTISAISGLTAGKIPKASSSSTLADSSISDDGTTVSSSLPISVIGTITSTSRISASGGGNGSNSGGYYFKYTSNTSSRSWILVNDYSVFGDFALLQSTTQVGTTYAPWIYVNAAGKIGLGGNVSPAYAVDITGDLNVAGTIRVNGVAIGTGGGGSITGSGTSARVALWNGTTSITNSIIRDNGSSVTVGSDNYVYKLSVNPIGTSHFGFGYTGTNSMFLNAVEIVNSAVISTVPLVYNATVHSWLTGFNLKMELRDTGQLFIGTTGVYGGGTLQVNGDVNITGGQFKIDGVAIGGGGGGGGGTITGSGTNGFITQWNGSTSITNSGIYFNGTNYGIAMTSPNYRLDVNGSINVTGAFYVNGSPIGAGGGGVGGGGTVNKIARWTASNTLGDSSIYDAGTGSIGILNTSPSYQIDVTGTIRATGDIIITSDRRKKENIQTIENALETIMGLRGVTYNKINDAGKKKQIGFIAQEVLPYVPEVVYEDNDEYLGVAYQNMVALLTEAIKEQQKQIEELKNKLK